MKPEIFIRNILVVDHSAEITDEGMIEMIMADEIVDEMAEDRKEEIEGQNREVQLTSRGNRASSFSHVTQKDANGHPESANSVTRERTMIIGSEKVQFTLFIFKSEKKVRKILRKNLWKNS